MDSEQNRNERRDRKSDKRKFGMSVDDSAKQLALILRNRRLKEQQTRNQTNKEK